MDMTPEERAEVAPGAVISDDVEKPLSVKGAEFGLSMTPVGTAMEVAEELSSASPSWLNIGLAVAPDLLGLGPVADPLMKAIKGTKFKTAKGSTYEVTDSNTTVRNKAARPEHPGESGVQPQSKKTIYMPREELEKFAGIHQNPDIGTEFIPTGENTAALRYTEDYGPRKAGDIVPGTEITFTLDPEVGLNPVEILDFRNPRGIHFGNEIIEVESNIPKVSRSKDATDPDDPMFEFTSKTTGVTKTFNEGGMAMDKQMDAVFKSSRTGYAEGGEVGEAPDTTIGLDPVSGNEVPMGATPEEVRDDIPAQLSEGEYVIPADVVRFYGVKFFEGLRTEAKQGYAEMDQNGRIGGEPVGQEDSGMEMVEPEDDLPFDISELQIIDDETGMYEGGLAGYAEGGLPAAPATTQVPMNPFSPTGTTAGFEIKEYVNDAGEVMYIQFMNGQPMTFIPQGFKPKGTAAEQAAEQAATGEGVAAEAAPTVSVSGNDYDYDTEMGRVGTEFTEGATAKDWTKASVDDFSSATKGLGSGLGTMAGALVGGPIGAVIGIGSQDAARKKAYDMLDGIAYQLESDNLTEGQKSDLITQKQQIQKYLEPSSSEGKFGSGIVKGSGIFGGATTLYENLGDYGGTVVDGEVVGDGKRTFADTWLGDLLGADGKAGVQGPGLSESLSGARRTAVNADGTDGWEDMGDAERAAARMEAREATPYEKALTEAQKQKAEGNTEAANKEYDKAISTATNSWVAATNAVNASGNDPIARHNAIMAQSAASRAATKAIQEKNNRTGFFGLKTKDD
jgi:hypothetical protein